MDTVHATEEWRPVEGWPYEVSSLGRVRRVTSAQGTRAGYILRPSLNKGYPFVNLSRGNEQRTFEVHVLVCTAFHGPKPAPEMQTRHLDGNRQNNVFTNLVWGTVGENREDSRVHGTMPLGEKHPDSLISDLDVERLRIEYAAARHGRSRAPVGWRSDAAERFGIKVRLLEAIVGGQHRLRRGA